jgi:hypothetical protein
MSTIPTAEEAAKHVVAIFVKYGARAGHVLPERRVIRGFWKAPWSPDDFAPGLGFAIQQGWIERTSQGEYRLTEAGFAAA